MSNNDTKEYNIDEKFNKYISKVKKLDHVGDNDKLILYGLYKQANEGNNNNNIPSVLNIVEMAKWKAWNSFKGLSDYDAKKKYIRKVKELYIKNDF
jgi:diazepam-binding inhibitor (GABA receptor modulating acyl-CoA-binding protein)